MIIVKTTNIYLTFINEINDRFYIDIIVNLSVTLICKISNPHPISINIIETQGQRKRKVSERNFCYLQSDLGELCHFMRGMTPAMIQHGRKNLPTMYFPSNALHKDFLTVVTREGY